MNRTITLYTLGEDGCRQAVTAAQLQAMELSPEDLQELEPTMRAETVVLRGDIDFGRWRTIDQACQVPAPDSAWMTLDETRRPGATSAACVASWTFARNGQPVPVSMEGHDRLDPLVGERVYSEIVTLLRPNLWANPDFLQRMLLLKQKRLQPSPAGETASTPSAAPRSTPES